MSIEKFLKYQEAFKQQSKKENFDVGKMAESFFTEVFNLPLKNNTILFDTLMQSGHFMQEFNTAIIGEQGIAFVPATKASIDEFCKPVEKVVTSLHQLQNTDFFISNRKDIDRTLDILYPARREIFSKLNLLVHDVLNKNEDKNKDKNWDTVRDKLNLIQSNLTEYHRNPNKEFLNIVEGARERIAYFETQLPILREAFSKQPVVQKTIGYQPAKR